MPHIIVEYSADIDQSHDMDALCNALFDAAAGSGIFDHDIAAIKTRATAYTHSKIGTEGQSFAHATIRLLSGRTTDAKSGLTQIILATLDQMLPTATSLSVDIKDIDRATYAKRTL